jgi:hypothetical protein
MKRRRPPQRYAPEIRALRRSKATKAMLEAIADHVQARQHAVICRNLRDLGRTPRNGKPPAWAELSAKERESWRQGVRLYLGAAVLLGWRPPASERKAKRPGTRRIRAA